jgi:hypothetical protein
VNLKGIVGRRGELGTLTRMTYDLTTGFGTEASVSVMMGLQRNNFADEIKAGLVVKQPTIVMLSKEILDDAGFVTPVKVGDIVEANGVKCTIRHVMVKGSGGTTIYYCQGEST